MSKIISRIIAWVFVAVSVMPIYWVISTSFKPEEKAISIPPVLVFTPSLKAYIGLFVNSGFLHFLQNSIIVSLVVIVVSLLFGTLAAYSLARYETGGRTMTFSILVVHMIPPMIITFPLYMFIQNLGLIDTRLGLILAQFSFTLPFTIWVMRQFFMQIPVEIEQAARIDGANIYQIFFRIIIPISRAGLVTVIIFVFINSWNEFLYALVLTISNAQTITIAASQFVTSYDIQWSQIDAVTTIIMVPSVIITLLLRRFIVAGLIGDSTKG